MLIRIHINLAQYLLIAVLGISGSLLHAQSGLYNNGQTIFINAGTTVSVKGDLENANTGSLENNGNLWLEGDLTNQAVYKPGVGLVFMDGSADQGITIGGDTISRLIITSSAAGFKVNVLGGPLVVRDSLALDLGRLVSSPAQYVRLDFGADLTGGTGNSYVAGPLDIQKTGNVLFPIGDLTDFRPVALDGVTSGGTAPIIRFSAVNYGLPSAPGSDGLGTTNRSGKHYWLGSIEGGSYTGASDIVIDYGVNNLTGTTALFNAGYRQVISNSSTLGGDYVSLGIGTGGLPATAGSIQSDSVIGTQLGYFVLGECQHIAGNAYAIEDTICIGSPAMVYAQNHPLAGVNYMWYSSADGISFSPIAATNNDSLYLSDTLSQQKFYRMQVAGGNCWLGTTSITNVTVRPTIALNLTAFLQGPYDIIGDTMFCGSNGLNANPWLLLDSMFAYNSTVPVGPKMHFGYSIPDTMVDVVKIELYKDVNSDNQPDVKVDSSYGWVTRNGKIVNFYNGKSTSPVRFCGTDSSGYFVVLRHRNHLPVSSSNLISLRPGTTTTLDFSNSANVNNGTYEMVEVSPGRYALYAGNVYMDIGSGDVFEVNAMDVLKTQYGVLLDSVIDYDPNDSNLDGFVNSLDYSIVSENNDMLVSTSVPPF